MKHFDVVVFLFVVLFSSVTFSNDNGTPAVVRLTDDLAPITHLSSAETKDLAQALSSEKGNCPTDRPVRDSADNFHLDIEFRTYMVSGFAREGERTTYSNASFDDQLQRAVKSAHSHGALAGKSLSASLQSMIKRLTSKGQHLSEDQKKELLDVLLRDRIVRADPSQRPALYREAGKLMSFEDQIAFVAKLGGEMSSNYDDARADEGIGATNIPTCDQVLSALGTDKKVGVCRDIHMCMGQVLSDMGNEGHVYGISFASPGNYHVTLVATDPRNPDRVHKINYNEHGSSDLQDVAALAQDHTIPDVGISYRLWKPSGNGRGEMVAALPSQLGLVLNEMTGGVNTRDFDPTIRQDYGLVSASAGAGPWNGRVFSATLANGDRVLGVATHVRWNKTAAPKRGEIFDGLSHHGSIGLAFAHRMMERPNGGEMAPMTINTIYLNVQDRVSAPIRLSNNFVIEPNAGYRIQGAFLEGGFAEERGKTGDGDVALSLGGTATLASGNERSFLRLAAGTQLTLGLADIRGLSSSAVTVVPNHTFISLEGEQLASAEVRLNARFLYVFREYGDTFQATTGAVIDSSRGRTALNLGFITPVGPANGFMPGGSSPSLLIGLNHSVLTDDGDRSILDISTTYTQRLNDGRFMFNTGLAVHF
ncbi:MAG: hypothetical protein A2X86_14695 [Bdellovibrionales bacterium GWA2_49_15]|nr:MAG: hypothetical protein A2X86_14695 [Bdellovibrionales bacterium GWA2_49_15]HAZ13411.1 hypothetical protein [Bdellovibrionales bacterium]